MLRIVATHGIIWLHTNGTAFVHPDINPFTNSELHFFVVNYYLMCWAVPVFFMITGALLLNPSKEISYKKCFLYMRRILLALVIFGIGYSLLLMRGKGNSFNFIQAIIDVYEGKSFGHLWYLYVLIGIYLTLPLFKIFVASASKKEIQIFLVVLFVFDFCLTIGYAVGKELAFELPITWPIFYLLLGYYLNYVDDSLYRFRFILWLFISLCG